MNNKTADCTNIVLSGDYDVRVAPYNSTTPAVLADAVSLGGTTGGVELTGAKEQKLIEIDQVPGAIDAKTTKAALNGKTTLSEVSLDNVGTAFGTESTPTVDGDNTVLEFDADSDKKYTLFIVSKGPKDPTTKKAKTRVYQFYKVSFRGNPVVTISKTDEQTLPLEWDCLMECPKTSQKASFGRVYDTTEDIA